MAHFAHVKNGIVDAVIVVEQTYIDGKGGAYCPHCGELRPKEEWVQTSYNTRKGEHVLGGTPLRKNFAGIGFTYDKTRDAFIPPRPFASWNLDEQTCTWNPPKARPVMNPDERNEWDEATQEWVVTNVKTREVWRR